MTKNLINQRPLEEPLLSFVSLSLRLAFAFAKCARKLIALTFKQGRKISKCFFPPSQPQAPWKERQEEVRQVRKNQGKHHKENLSKESTTKTKQKKQKRKVKQNASKKLKPKIQHQKAKQQVNQNSNKSKQNKTSSSQVNPSIKPTVNPSINQSIYNMLKIHMLEQVVSTGDVCGDNGTGGGAQELSPKRKIATPGGTGTGGSSSSSKSTPTVSATSSPHHQPTPPQRHIHSHSASAAGGKSFSQGSSPAG